MSQSRTSRLLVSAAALVIVIAAVKAANDIVGPLMLALALTIVFHPLRVRLERRLPSWATSVVVLVLAYVLILGLTFALVISLGRLAALIPTYTPDVDDMVAAIGDQLESLGVSTHQVEAVEGAMDPGRLTDAITGFLSGILSVLSDLFFLVTLLL
jgi:AI-2 transport protein TqsA